MHDIKKKLDALKIKDYKKIIETIDAKVDRFTNIKKACEIAGVPYRLYYTARSFLAKYDKPVEITKVFKNKQNYIVDRNELEKKRKDEIMELMQAMDKNNEDILEEREPKKIIKRIEKETSENKKSDRKYTDKINRSEIITDGKDKYKNKDNKNIKSIYDILGPEHKNFS